MIGFIEAMTPGLSEMNMEPVPKIDRITSNRLSCFRSEHEFLHYGEFESVSEYTAYRNWSEKNGVPLLILGAGSNILFARRRIRALVLRNRLPKVVREIDGQTLEVSSTVMLAQVLKWCEERDLDSFYYLASVPASVGGAVAMNAGRGRSHGKTIYDFVESVTVLEECGDIRTLQRGEIPVDYRETPFTGVQSRLILSVVFRFSPLTLEGSPRRERILWSKANQDHSLPNCGSVFRKYQWSIMKRLKGVRFFKASYSKKTDNWILNSGKSSWSVVWLIRLTMLLHRIVFRRAHLELIEVK